MRSARFRHGLLAAIVSLLFEGTINAQPAVSSLEGLTKVLASDTKVSVTDTSGDIFRGIIVDATESALLIRIKSEIRRFEAADIRFVRVRKPDSVANGALIGAAVGAGLTSLIFLDNECRDDPECYGALAVYSGIGAVAGFPIDALISRSVVVYAAPQKPRSFTVAPMIKPGRLDLRVAIQF